MILLNSWKMDRMDEYNSLLEDILAYFIDPARKTYLLYMASAILIAVVYLYFFKAGEGAFRKRLQKYLFNKKHWTGASAACDYFLLITNSLIRVFFIVPFVFSGLALSYYIAKWCMLNLDNLPRMHLSKTSVAVSYTLALWLLGDFSRFFLHYLAHRIPFLWELHKVHHSAQVLNPFTLFRQHPLEMFLFHVRGTLVFAIVTGFFYFYFPTVLKPVEILGINAGRFIFLFAGANLRHSHVPITYGKFWEHIFISPLQHQIHHSIDKSDHHRNMGSHLAIWDWLFGTLKTARKEKTEYEFGIPSQQNENHHSLAGALWIPVKRAFGFKK